MSSPLEFTGERFIPGAAGAIAYEHGHRYAFALRHARRRRVLDAACGEGYGTAMLAGVAASVLGVDLSAEAIAHARQAYAGAANARFEVASVTDLPVPDRSMDLVVSFETIEHIAAEAQVAMLAEFARVLATDGLLLLSSPNRRRYSDARDYHNPFHVHELYRDELERLLDRDFPHRCWYAQAPIVASALWSEGAAQSAEAWLGDAHGARESRGPEALYFVVLAAREAGALPGPEPRLSVFQDEQETELQAAEAAQAEVMRLDQLLGERDVSLEMQTAHVLHLEELAGARERLVQQRDRELAAVNAAREDVEGLLHAARAEVLRLQAELAAAADRARESEAARAHAESAAAAAAREHEAAAALAARTTMLEAELQQAKAALAAQERIIAYRQSARWWLRLPWVRVRALWQKVQP